MVEAVRRARAAAERADKDAVSARVRAAVERSGLAARRFAAEVGTSASRLSTYCTGAVQPSAAMLLRIERESQRLAAGHDADTGRHDGRGRGHP
jgi:transcriptional regulator with XRE-family HTH domain